MSGLLRVGTDAVQESASSRCSDMAGILLIIPIDGCTWQPTSAWSTRRHEGIPDSNSPTRFDRAVSFAPSQECALCPRAWPSVFSPGYSLGYIISTTALLLSIALKLCTNVARLR